MKKESCEILWILLQNKKWNNDSNVPKNERRTV